MALKPKRFSIRPVAKPPSEASAPHCCRNGAQRQYFMPRVYLEVDRYARRPRSNARRDLVVHWTKIGQECYLENAAKRPNAEERGAVRICVDADPAARGRNVRPERVERLPPARRAVRATNSGVVRLCTTRPSNRARRPVSLCPPISRTVSRTICTLLCSPSATSSATQIGRAGWGWGTSMLAAWRSESMFCNLCQHLLCYQKVRHDAVSGNINSNI